MNVEDYEATLLTRDVRTSSVTAVELAEGDNRISPPGTIALLVADTDSGHLARLRRAADQRDPETQTSVMRDVIQQFRSALSEGGTFALDNIPCLADVVYKTKTLRRGMFVTPEYEVAFSVVQYNGAALDMDAFRLIEYYTPDASRLDALVVMNKPSLSEIETEILSRVDPSIDIVNIGETVGEFANVVAMAQAVEAAARAVYHFFENVFGLPVSATFDETLLIQTLSDMDQRSSAEVLTQMRTQLLAELRGKDAASAARTLLRARTKAAGLEKTPVRRALM